MAFHIYPLICLFTSLFKINIDILSMDLLQILFLFFSLVQITVYYRVTRSIYMLFDTKRLILSIY